MDTWQSILDNLNKEFDKPTKRKLKEPEVPLYEGTSKYFAKGVRWVYLNGLNRYYAVGSKNSKEVYLYCGTSLEEAIKARRDFEGSVMKSMVMDIYTKCKNLTIISEIKTVSGKKRHYKLHDNLVVMFNHVRVEIPSDKYHEFIVVRDNAGLVEDRTYPFDPVTKTYHYNYLDLDIDTGD